MYDIQQHFIQYENKSCLYECYYCDRFTPTDNKEEYLKHVVLNHNNKPAYPSFADLTKNKLKPKGKNGKFE